MTDHIAFIGVGTMGGPMVRNLVRKGFRVTAFDLNASALDLAVELGAERSASAAEASRSADIAITMLPNSPHEEAAVLGPDGVFAGLQPGKILIEMSTIDPVMTKRIGEAAAERGIRMIDAPVSGSSVGAVDGTLTMMVGGDAETFEQCKLALSAMGSNVIHVGPLGMGETVKLVNNMLAGIGVVATAEAVNIAERAGLDPQAMFDVITKSSGDSWAFRNRLPVSGVNPAGVPADEDFAPGFMTMLMLKDIDLGIGLARSVGAPSLLAAIASQYYAAACAKGVDRKDFSSVVEAVRALNAG
ncbi:MAG: 3-hydroxyisobutyrate dehydrogenase [Chloroflexota bacterium]